MIKVFRFGHRIVRDKRVTTHCALVSRAFGANEMLYCGQEDNEIELSITKINRKWGSNFKITFVKEWFDKLRELKKDFIIVHLTMYGLAFNEFIAKISNIENKNKEQNILIFIGSQKVPLEVYEIADYNISVTNQPHSEIAALALTLDRLNPEILTDNKNFDDAKIKIKPNNKPKIKQ